MVTKGQMEERQVRKNVEFESMDTRRKKKQLSLLLWSCGFTEGGGREMENVEIRISCWFVGKNQSQAQFKTDK